jgi:septum formation protein
MSLILASGSASRQAMLRQAGVPFEAHPVRIDEEAIRHALQAEGAKPHDVADALAEYKAIKAAGRFPEARILASDQVLDLKGTIFSKPADRDGAKACLARLSGQTHRLLSAAVIYDGGEPVWRAIGQARLTMHSLTEAEIDAYLDRAWPDVASSVGAYHAESHGARLFSRIDGDWFSVLGLPLLNVLSFLRQRGWLDP